MSRWARWNLQLRRQMQLELKRLQKQVELTFIYITHDQEEALNMSDRIAVMHDGRFEQVGTPAEVYDRPRTSFVARFVGTANIVEGRVAENRNGTLMVHAAGGEVPALCCGCGKKAGDGVTLAVRSEHVEFCRRGRPARHGEGKDICRRYAAHCAGPGKRRRAGGLAPWHRHCPFGGRRRARDMGCTECRAGGYPPGGPGMKQRRQTGIWLMLAPLYIFTILFVAGPLIYMVVLSFLQRGEVWGVVNSFTLDNYKNILTPIYLQTFAESFKLAITSTVFITLLGYPFGYFMAKLPPVWKKRMMLLIMIPFWTNSLIRLYGWMIIFRANGTLDQILMGLGLTSCPLKLLYTYPAVVVGMVYALLQFMILAVYSSAEKMDWSLVEAARDLGASALPRRSVRLR